MQTGASISSGLSGVSSLTSPGGATGPLGPVAGLFSNISSKLNIDVSGLTDRFPQALTTIQNAVGGGTLDFVGSLTGSFSGAADTVGQTPLAQAASGSSLQDAALGVVSAALASFEQNQTQLGQKLIDPSTLQSITSTLGSLRDFGSDFAAHRGDFLPFLSRTLLGVAPDLLSTPMAHVNQAQSVLAQIDPSALAVRFNGPANAFGTALRDLQALVLTFDPADAAAYAQLDSLLQAVNTAMQAMQTAASALYSALAAAFSSHAWDTILQTLQTLMDAVPLASIPTLDDLTEGVSNILQGILTHIETALSPVETAQKIETFSAGIRDFLNQSPLQQVRRVIRDFLGTIRHAIESIPTDQIQQAVEGMLARIQSEVDSLGLDHIGTAIEGAFHDLETFITSSINDTLRDQVRQALQTLLSGLGNLPVETLATSLEQIVAQVQALIQELEQTLQAGFDQISDALSQLDQLSFKPVGDAVVGEIDNVKARLLSINPNALSDVEKVAIKAAVAILEGIDLDGFVRDQVKKGFSAGKDALLQIVNEVDAALHTLRDRVAAFDPQQLVAAVTKAVDEAKAVANLDARTLLRPLYSQLDHFAQQLNAFSPGALLEPLTHPFEQALAKVDQLDPGVLVEPLRHLYAELDRLLGFVDVTPLLEELDRRQKQLFTAARQAILSAIDGLSLPEPLGSFFTNLRPVMEALTEALFGDPESELHKVSLDIASRVKLSTLFEPLDRLFVDLVKLLEGVPQQELVDAFNALRVGIGTGLDIIDPGRLIRFFQEGLGRLQEASPGKLLVLAQRLPALQVSFQLQAAAAPAGMFANVAGINARFDAAIQLNAAPALASAHAQLENALRQRLKALTSSAAGRSVEASYARLKSQLDRVLPAFLRSPDPVDFATILAGINTLRPSLRAVPLEDMINRFLARLKPMEDVLEPAMNTVFAALRDAISLLSPLSIKDAVAEIYAAIRDKYRILDPDRLATALRAIFDPLRAAVNAINPAVLRARLDAAFHAALNALSSALRSLLDEVADILDDQFKRIHDAVASIAQRVDEAGEAAAQAFQDVVSRLEHLVFVEIIDHIRRLLSNLDVSFGQEVDRVRNAFRQMLAAIPGGSSASASVTA
jgi:hypothetical protein